MYRFFKEKFRNGCVFQGNNDVNYVARFQKVGKCFETEHTFVPKSCL